MEKFKKGTRVELIGEGDFFKTCMSVGFPDIGDIGVIENYISNDDYFVRFDKSGMVFIVSEENIKECDKIANCVRVKFKGSNLPYTFYTDLDLKVDDVVLVDTSTGLSLGTVFDFDCRGQKPTKTVVAKVDMDMVSKKIENFNEILKKQEKEDKRKAILEEIKNLKKKLREL